MHLAAAAQISASEATTRAVRRHEPCELRRAARAVRSQRRAAANESMKTPVTTYPLHAGATAVRPNEPSAASICELASRLVGDMYDD